MDKIEIRIDPHPTHRELADLWRASWEIDGVADFRSILTRSLTHTGAYVSGGYLIGFANLAWDGGIHGFLTDVCVLPDYRDHGVGQSLVEAILSVARKRGLEKIHTDFDPYLKKFYLSCGFKPVEAGILNVKSVRR